MGPSNIYLIKVAVETLENGVKYVPVETLGKYVAMYNLDYA